MHPLGWSVEYAAGQLLRSNKSNTMYFFFIFFCFWYVIHLFSLLSDSSFNPSNYVIMFHRERIYRNKRSTSVTSFFFLSTLQSGDNKNFLCTCITGKPIIVPYFFYIYSNIIREYMQKFSLQLIKCKKKTSVYFVAARLLHWHPGLISKSCSNYYPGWRLIKINTHTFLINLLLISFFCLDRSNNIFTCHFFFF